MHFYENTWNRGFVYDFVENSKIVTRAAIPKPVKDYELSLYVASANAPHLQSDGMFVQAARYAAKGNDINLCTYDIEKIGEPR